MSGARKKTKKNVMAWMEPEEIALVKSTASALDVDMTRLLKMAVKLASNHLEEMKNMKRSEDENKG